jgi:rhodanese-related sulfurtransferase
MHKRTRVHVMESNVPEQVPEVDVTELARALGTGAMVVDVREPDEYEAVHVPGAQLIPLGTVPERLDEVPATDGPLYVICAKGGRSYKAAEFYRAQGIDAVNVAGGTTAWVEAGHPTANGLEP